MDNKTKYPRTPHLAFSQNASSDDKILTNHDHFINQEIIVTIKLDGENTSLYRDFMHARSVDSPHHPSRDWIKNLHAQIKHEIPETFRICGENVYAKHTIHYQNLTNYFYVFSIWNQQQCLSWDDTLDYCAMLNVEPVPVIYRGQFDQKMLEKLTISNFNNDPAEGYVIRNTKSFNYSEFGLNVAKNVFKTFQITSDSHWRNQGIIPNKIK